MMSWKVGLRTGGVIASLALFGSCGGSAVVTGDGGGGTGGSTTTTTSTGGGSGGTGGTTTGSATCPALPHCNWCGGTEVVDANGCVVGWTCANGVDPCTTSPCESNDDCAPDGYCDENGLCWPCVPGTCTVGGSGSNMTCSCSSGCGDGAVLSFECSTSSMGGNCDCFENGILVSICDIDGPPGDPCAIGFMCCNWPNADDA
jgi:hypothetical protein